MAARCENSADHRGTCDEVVWGAVLIWKTECWTAREGAVPGSPPAEAAAPVAVVGVPDWEPVVGAEARLSWEADWVRQGAGQGLAVAAVSPAVAGGWVERSYEAGAPDRPRSHTRPRALPGGAGHCLIWSYCCQNSVMGDRRVRCTW